MKTTYELFEQRQNEMKKVFERFLSDKIPFGFSYSGFEELTNWGFEGRDKLTEPIVYWSTIYISNGDQTLFSKSNGEYKNSIKYFKGQQLYDAICEHFPNTDIKTWMYRIREDDRLRYKTYVNPEDYSI